MISWIMFGISAIVSGLVGLLKWFVSREIKRIDDALLEHAKMINDNSKLINENAKAILENTTYDKGARSQLKDLRDKLDRHLDQGHGTLAYIDEQIKNLRLELLREIRNQNP